MLSSQLDLVWWSLVHRPHGLGLHTPSSEKHQEHHCVHALLSTARQLALWLFSGSLSTVTSAGLQLAAWVLCTRAPQGGGGGEPRPKERQPPWHFAV